MSKETTARSAMKRTVDKIKSTFWEGYLPEPVKPRGEATLAQQCKWPTCQSEEYQQALAEQIKRELVGEQPAQRTWVGLTDEEMNAALDYWSEDERSAYGGAHAADGEYVSMIDTWRYIEAKLKEKNNG